MLIISLQSKKKKTKKNANDLLRINVDGYPGTRFIMMKIQLPHI